MADPATLAIISGVVSSGGKLFTGVQGYYEGTSTAKQLKSEAVRTEKEAQWAANRIRSRARRLAGTQRARFAAAGVGLSGSAVDVQADSAWQSEVDAMTTLYKGNIAAAGLRTNASAAKRSGVSALISGSFSGAGSVIGGMGTANMINAQNNPSFTGDK